MDTDIEKRFDYVQATYPKLNFDAYGSIVDRDLIVSPDAEDGDFICLYDDGSIQFFPKNKKEYPISFQEACEYFKQWSRFINFK